MVHLVLHWLITALAVLLASWIVPGVRVRGFGTALAVAAVFGVLNALLGWLGVLVLGVATLGLGFVLVFLTRWIVNTVLLRITDALIPGFEIAGWGRTALAALVIAVASSGAHYFIWGH